MSRWMPHSLFMRTALLIAGTLLLFSLIAWQAIAWTAILPAAELTTQVLAQRAAAAVVAHQSGLTLPEGTRIEWTDPASGGRELRGFGFGVYVETVRRNLQSRLHSPQVLVDRIAGPTEIWVRSPQIPGAWLVLTWRLASPTLPLVLLAVLAGAALLVLGAAAFSARRLTAPLAGLAHAAARVAEGDMVDIDVRSGPSEVRALATAFQSMSHRLAELDGQRELLLGGISHDLRTPLARIRVAIELLDSADSALATEMTANVEEIDRMITQFLHYVRSNYREAPTLACANSLLRETLTAFGGDERIHLQLQADESRSFAADCLRHTVLNLVQNALEYGRPPVTVALGFTDAELIVSVRDCGDGLSATQWEEAIQPFSRLREQPRSGHCGLGLAMVVRLVEVCGGRLDAAQGDGGFNVCARLPATRSAPPSAALL